MEKTISLFNEYWQSLIAFSPRILVAAIVLVVSYLIGIRVARIIMALLKRTSLRDVHESFFRTFITIAFLFLGSIASLNILGLEKLAVSIFAGGGVTAIILGFAFREIGENFLAGLFLAFSRPFKVGDAIKTEDIEGVVRDIELRYTHLRTGDGRDIYVPSTQLFGRPLTNFTKDGLRRISFTVGIDYSNDARDACSILQKSIERQAGILQDPPPRAYISNLLPQYVEIELFYWVDVFDKTVDTLSLRTEIMDGCRKVLLGKGFVISSDTTTNIAITNASTGVGTI